MNLDTFGNFCGLVFLGCITLPQLVWLVVELRREKWERDLTSIGFALLLVFFTWSFLGAVYVGVVQDAQAKAAKIAKVKPTP